jgi:hypothetical protein
MPKPQTARSSSERAPLLIHYHFEGMEVKLQSVVLSRLNLVRPMKPCQITALRRPYRSEDRRRAVQC